MPTIASWVVRGASTSLRGYDNTVRGYYIQNFGCRAAQADGAAIERQLTGLGLERVDSAERAEVVVLNTCTVTSAADQDARAAIRHAHRESPHTKILVTGCYAQRAPKELIALPGVTWVVGNSHKDQIGQIVAGTRSDGGFVPVANLSLGTEEPAGPGFVPRIYASDIFAHTVLEASPVFDGIERSRPNLKVQDGCDNRCSFCVIPFVRGQSRSLPLDKVLLELEALERAGYREVVLSGINLGRWGRDFVRQSRFVDLVHAVLAHSSIAKLRLSSIEPMDWTEELIDLLASSPRIAKHAHIPLQSGSDRILRKMHRKYRPWHYAEKVERIRSLLPYAAIGADVMVGFPGETDELFEESLRFIEQMPFTYLHVFTYSPRPGTPAAEMESQVALSVARQRNRILRNVSAEKNLKFRSALLGSEIEAITLQKTSADATAGLSDNYIKLEVYGHHPANTLLKVRALSVSQTGLAVEPCGA
ncbi:MAG: tRNA (N(6)-L-threonylcarbamoyladenosine(37)-C(2))-methylthiotransferase MtaB [Acidobacteria bacterium]|nr:tRNA (N(6)-L-threonylcarbamoyladenosine(37)-C(2))-methylthiotransferase MtaB [Acidobacteriota bacterium]